MNRLTKTLLIALGSLCVTLGVIGMFIPILPTTPFLLLAAFFYARSSQRFYHWLLTNRWFGEYIRNYREGNGMPLRQKVFTIVLLWLTIGVAIFFMITTWWVRLILLAIACGVTYHLISIKTYKPTANTLSQYTHPTPSEELD